MNINYLLADMTRAELEELERAIKTRKLELDYDELYDKYRNLQDENEELQNDIERLKDDVEYYKDELEKIF